MKLAVKTMNLGKIYENGVEALKNINLKIIKGEIFALLGPNGAGKSTFIKIITGITKPTKGEAYVLDTPVENLLESETRTKISYVPQENIFWDQLTVEENMDYFASMYKMDKKTNKEIIRELLEKFDLYEKKNVKAEKLSGGMKRKLTIAMALINDPDILILDEPTTGLDPRARAELIASLELLREKNRTIIVTTHLIDEAEKLADRVAIIDSGEILAVGEPKEIKNRVCGEEILDLLVEPGKNGYIREQLEKALYDWEFTEVGDRVLLKGSNLLEIVNKINSSNALKDALLAINLRKPTLEDAFLLLTGKELG